jgi:GH15 family glucan-1,4-alpha-glucosidase
MSMHTMEKVKQDQGRKGGSKPYLPIEEYGVIGNLRTVALIGSNGSIDWCCLPNLDCPSVFGALLDAQRGGRFRVAPASHRDGLENGDQQYVEGTNTLRTIFSGDHGSLTVTDFMPVRGDLEGPFGSHCESEIHRIVECTAGEIEVEVEWAPRFDYARQRTHIRRGGRGYLAEGDGLRLSLSEVPGAAIEDDPHGPTLRARLTLAQGQRVVLVTRWDAEPTDSRPEASQTMLDQTNEAWKAWLNGRGSISAKDWAGEWLPYVDRASLVFKLLAQADTGAIAAAATTSLPETIGGIRNWDYRYAWIRDAAMTAQAMVALGHEEDAAALIGWMEEISAEHEDGGRNLRVMYGLHGEVEMPEKELEHLEGYRGSTPVRIGNEAAEQFQLEVFGELVNSAYEMARRGRQWSPKIKTFIRHVAETAGRLWQKPDSGIWEVRGEPQHYTYSKVMAWVALERAIRLVNEYGFEGDVERWSGICEEIKQQVLEHGFNPRLGSFVTAFGTEELDASLLRIPLMEFLPAEDPRIEGTVNRIMEQLMVGDFVYRYHFDDGLPGEEGSFGLCTFWLVDVLSLAGRVDEATRIFRNMVNHASRLGLFSEEIDPHTSLFLGNFPQAFTHIGLINSALYLAWARGECLPEYAPTGTKEHREGDGKRPSGQDAGCRPQDDMQRS